MIDDNYSKTLIIYIGDSHYKYYDLYIEHVYEITTTKTLIVYKRDRHSGEETICSHFNTWDYFIIE